MRLFAEQDPIVTAFERMLRHRRNAIEAHERMKLHRSNANLAQVERYTEHEKYTTAHADVLDNLKLEFED